jgi:hypothetical protein
MKEEDHPRQKSFAGWVGKALWGFLFSLRLPLQMGYPG